MGFIQDILEYQFLQNALIAAILVSISAGIAGTYITSRRLVFLSGGITHASFGGIGIAYFLGINPIIGATIFSVLSALGIEALSHRKGIREDSAIGILWALGMATGIIFIFLTPGYAPNLMSFLFGSILTVTKSDLMLLLILDLVLILVFLLYSKTIIYVSFDSAFAQTQKIRVKTINLLLLTLMSVAIVLSIRAVGIVLLISLFTIPPSTANLFSNRFNRIIIWSILISLIGTIIGLIISYRVNIPSGAAIIIVFVLIFGFVKLLAVLITEIKRRKSMLNK